MREALAQALGLLARWSKGAFLTGNEPVSKYSHENPEG